MLDWEIFDVFLHNWEDSPGDDLYIRRGCMQFIDHPQKEKLVDWLIENYSGSFGCSHIRFVGGCVEYDSSFQKEFKDYIKGFR